ncbi:hypothetical protein [Cupriavidus campinensis]|uniref:hypothetical protein n=1 Tax=Cupriavidus campinensis TaxID=151783 RepID=UPI0011ED7431|nr:hypothetical protein [Cupriavidus campinensis]
MVASPCILPKIVPPRPASDAISRERLIGRLQAASDRKLVLLTGGAGFGKTTLMAQWRQRLDKAGARVAWLTLAMQDGTLPTFRAILTGALAHAGLAIEAGEGRAVRAVRAGRARSCCSHRWSKCSRARRPTCT